MNVVGFQFKPDAQAQEFCHGLGYRTFAERISLRRSPSDAEPVAGKMLGKTQHLDGGLVLGGGHSPLQYFPNLAHARFI